MTIDADIPLEANTADIIEQRQSIIDDDVMLPEELPLSDADLADALEQRLTVPIDEEDWPARPAN